MYEESPILKVDGYWGLHIVSKQAIGLSILAGNSLQGTDDFFCIGSVEFP